MTAYLWPAAWVPSAFEAQLVPNVRSFSSPYGGTSQSLDLLGERWRFLIELPPRSLNAAAGLEAYVSKLRGGVHRVNLWHMRRPVPRGTMRGTPSLSATMAQGAATASISTTPGATLLAGDVLGIGGMLLQVADDAQADGGGAVAVTLANRPRIQVGSGSAVTWNAPTAAFSLTSGGGVPVRYTPGAAAGVALEFLEVW